MEPTNPQSPSLAQETNSPSVPHPVTTQNVRKKDRKRILFFLLFFLVLGITVAAFFIKTMRQIRLQQNITHTIQQTTEHVLIRRSQIPGVIVRATTAKAIDVKTGKVIEAAHIFSVNDKTVYLSLDLQAPKLKTRIDYIRYKEGRYVDHGSVQVSDPTTKTIAFEWTVTKPTGSLLDGNWKVATYTNGILEKRVKYTISKNKIAYVFEE